MEIKVGGNIQKQVSFEPSTKKDDGHEKHGSSPINIPYRDGKRKEEKIDEEDELTEEENGAEIVEIGEDDKPNYLRRYELLEKMKKKQESQQNLLSSNPGTCSSFPIPSKQRT